MMTLLLYWLNWRRNFLLDADTASMRPIFGSLDFKLPHVYCITCMYIGSQPSTLSGGICSASQGRRCILSKEDLASRVASYWQYDLDSVRLG